MSSNNFNTSSICASVCHRFYFIIVPDIAFYVYILLCSKLFFLFRKPRKNPLQDRSGKRLYRFGNSDLDELWSACPDNLDACRDKRRLFQPPTLQTYFKDAILELDPREKVEEQYK